MPNGGGLPPFVASRASCAALSPPSGGVWTNVERPGPSVGHGVPTRSPTRRISYRDCTGAAHGRMRGWALHTGKTTSPIHTEQERRHMPEWHAYYHWLNPGDNAWQMTAATFVGLMSLPGLAVLYGGVMQKRWSVNSMMLT